MTIFFKCSINRDKIIKVDGNNIFVNFNMSYNNNNFIEMENLKMKIKCKTIKAFFFGALVFSKAFSMDHEGRPLQLHQPYMIKHPYTETYLFVSNDKIGGDQVVEAHRAIEDRNKFMLLGTSLEKVRILHMATGKYLFISNDKKGGDPVVEAHSASEEERNYMTIVKSRVIDNVVYIKDHVDGTPNDGKFLFVSNDKEGGDNVVEAHNFTYDDKEDSRRNAFMFVRS